MKKTKLLFCALAITALCSCQSTENKLHDQYVKMFEESYLFEDRQELEYTKAHLEIYEYLLEIKDDDEFVRAFDFVMKRGEEFEKYKKELEKKEESLYELEEAADNRLDALEKRMEAKAKYLGID